MTHRQRLGGIVIDCQGDLAEAARFWSAALGRESKDEGDGRYVSLSADGADPYWVVQKVEHAPRVHLDLETDDKEAECLRLSALGAREVSRIKGWIVMEAPTGHRFCLVGPDDPEALARDGREFE
ncbi:VOC family protein [Paracoccus luteus]|uniref:VOC family protein n=1 Tax=Paracoccus luteus TaxID=2508543 RepID=UPI00106FEBC9|nr:VOC family protein [Paracoccus luteus]